MPWTFENDRPIYTQLLEKIRLNIISGTYPIGSKLPSVRDLAADAAVNSQRTSGRYVTEDANMIQKMKEDIAQEKIEEFMKLMRQIGFEPEEICILIEKTIKEGKL